MAWALDTGENEREKAAEIIKGLPHPPPEVLKLRFEIARSSEQNDALWLVITVAAESMKKKSSVKKVTTFIGDVQQRLIDAGLQRFPYVRVEEAA